MGPHQARQNTNFVLIERVNFYDPDNNLIFVFVYLAKPIAPERKQTPGSGTVLKKKGLILILQKTFAGKAQN